MKILRLLQLVFTILTIIGAVYVFYTRGEANAGYAVVPMVFALITSAWIKAENKKKQDS